MSLKLPPFVGAICVMFFLLLASESQAQNAPPDKCLIQRGAWCIAEGPSVASLDVSSGRAVWRLYGGLNPSKYLEIFESPECAGEKLSSNIGVGDVKRGRANGIGFIYFDLRLNKSCSLMVGFPRAEFDSDREIFFLTFSAIRPCINKECIGGGLVEVREAVAAKLEKLK